MHNTYNVVKNIVKQAVNQIYFFNKNVTSLCQKFKFYNLYIFATQCRRP